MKHVQIPSIAARIEALPPEAKEKLENGRPEPMTYGGWLSTRGGEPAVILYRLWFHRPKGDFYYEFGPDEIEEIKKFLSRKPSMRLGFPEEHVLATIWDGENKYFCEVIADNITPVTEEQLARSEQEDKKLQELMTKTI